MRALKYSPCAHTNTVKLFSYEPLAVNNSPDTGLHMHSSVAPAIGGNNQTLQDTVCKDNTSINKSHSTRIPSSHLSGTENTTEFIFKSKCLNIANLNVRHIVPKIDELGIVMANDMGPDIFGACETFLETSIPDNQVAINGYEFKRKDRCDTQDKTGGGVILYYRTSLNCKRKKELEISNIETLWCEVMLPNSRPFLLCAVYRPPSAQAEWIDLFEEELSVAQTTGLEIILMGDFNIDLLHCTNKKWLNLVELFDLTQMVTKATRVTQTSGSIIDHVYSSNPENISECFVPHYSISDHFPVCFSRKINCKIKKTEHTTISFRCFKNFNEESFTSELSNELSAFTLSQSDINDDVDSWYAIINKHLSRHAPIKTRRVKSKRLPDWFTPEIMKARKIRDNSKNKNNWTDYKRYRNMTKNLIRKAKRKHFSESVTNLKDTTFNRLQSSTDLFADDTTFHINGKTISEIEAKLQLDSNEAHAWSKSNKLPINYDKTTSMIIGTKQRLHNNQKLEINLADNAIVNVNKQKLLGIFIDEHLLWTPHIDYLCSTISSRISLLKQLAKYVPIKVQKTYYQGYILPLLDYCSNTWGTTYKINIDRLNKLQKRAARIVLKADYTTPSTDMFKELDWMSVSSRCNYNKAVLTYKALNKLTPPYISDLLKPVSETSTRQLRSSENGSLAVPRSRTALYDKSFTYSASKLWNALPCAIKSAPSLSSFKRCVKEYFN